MPLYHCSAELRRVHSDAEWVVAGVLIEDEWVPALLDIERASARLIESGLVHHVDLPPVIAPDLRRAIGIARRLALAHGADPATSAGREVLRGGPTIRIGVGRN